MLALKTMKLPLAPVKHGTRPQLPSEILDRIAEFLYEGSYFQADTVLAFSLVSKHFRKSALPLLFGTISHVIRDELYHQEHGFDRLLDNQYLLGYIHTLHLLRPAENPDFLGPLDEDPAKRLQHEHMESDLQIIRDSLPYMLRLRRIRFDCSAAAAREIVDMLPMARQYELIFDHLYTSSRWPDLMAATTDIASSAQRHRLALGAFGGHPISHPAPGQRVFDVMSKGIAINLHSAWLCKTSEVDADTSLNVASTSPQFKKQVSWTELRLFVEHQERSPNQLARNPKSTVIPWNNLRRLELQWYWSLPLSEFVHSLASELINLRALRLRAHHQRIFHPDCAHEAPPQRHLADPPPFRSISIDYTEMQNLEEVEIDGICNHIPIQDLMGRNLRALRLHREDSLFSVYSAESQRHHKDILTAAKLSPDLERLELDIGYIDYLWHLVAIPSFEVDLEQYAFLNALTKFRHLKFLRLFPPFVAKGSPRNSRSVFHSPPIADDQAIRIFDHLHSQCPSLQLLSIVASPVIMNVDTMSWEVKREGHKTILTTGHRARNYQHRQIWIGSRRIRSEIRRFRMPPPYLSDADGWLLTRDNQGLRVIRSS